MGVVQRQMTKVLTFEEKEEEEPFFKDPREEDKTLREKRDNYIQGALDEIREKVFEEKRKEKKSLNSDGKNGWSVGFDQRKFEKEIQKKNMLPAFWRLEFQNLMVPELELVNEQPQNYAESS